MSDVVVISYVEFQEYQERRRQPAVEPPALPEPSQPAEPRSPAVSSDTPLTRNWAAGPAEPQNRDHSLAAIFAQTHDRSHTDDVGGKLQPPARASVAGVSGFWGMVVFNCAQAFP